MLWQLKLYDMKKILIIILLLPVLTTIAQVKNGIIEYKAEMNLKHKKKFIEDIKKKDINMNTKQGVIQMYENAEPDYYILKFNDNESYYYKDKGLDQKGKYNIGSKAGLNPFYFNTSSDMLIEDSKSFGFVKKNLLDWEITKESKNIAGYICYKAKTVETLYSRQGHYYDREIIAWFSPEIPVKLGPKNYVGLPGLVLEVVRKEFTITAKNINLNPNTDDLKIKSPRPDDKIIVEKEKNERIAEKMKDYNKG